MFEFLSSKYFTCWLCDVVALTIDFNYRMVCIRVRGVTTGNRWPILTSGRYREYKFFYYPGPFIRTARPTRGPLFFCQTDAARPTSADNRWRCCYYGVAIYPLATLCFETQTSGGNCC